MSNSQQHDNKALASIILGIVAIALFATIFGEQIKGFTAKANYYTMILIHYVTKSKSLGLTLENLRKVSSAAEFSWEDIWFLTSLTGKHLRWVFLPLFAVWVLYLGLKDPKYRFRRKQTIKTLLEKNAKTFFSVRPIVGEDLLSNESYRKHWVPMMSPLQFALHNEILTMGDKDKKNVTKYVNGLLKKRQVLDSNLIEDYERLKYDIGQAQKVFERQVGEIVWSKNTGPKSSHDLMRIFNKFPAHKQALLTVLLCHYVAEGSLKKDGDLLLEQFANCYYIDHLKKKRKKKTWSVHALDITGVRDKFKDIIKNYDIEIILIPFAFHAWSHTILISIFERVKTITSSDFIWLKPVDRDLWYVLNGVGRKTYASECAGAFAHYHIENGLKHPVAELDVDSAVFGLRSFLAEEAWIEKLKDEPF